MPPKDACLPNTQEPPTVAQLLRWARDRLLAAGCDDIDLEAELLLSHVLRWSRTRLSVYPNHQPTAQQRIDFSQLLARRMAREPLAYILGAWEFYGLQFDVGPEVLIPRPETEFLVELALEHLSTAEAISPLIADVGTGSGAIAITLAKHLSAASVCAIDISAQALAIARGNAQQHRVASRVHLVRSDLLTSIAGRFDGIVANLPYVESGERGDLQPEVAQYEPWLALDGGRDGLDLVRRLLFQAGDRLRPNGLMLLEIGASQGSAALWLAKNAFPDDQCQLLRDYAGRDRVISIRKRFEPSNRRAQEVYG